MFPNMLDYTFLILVVVCYLLSSLRAGPKQLFTFLVTVASFFMAARGYEGVASVFPEKVFPPGFAGAVSFFLVFLVILGGISLAGRIMEDFFKRLSFGTADAFINRGLGVVKGFMLGCMTVVVIMVNYSLDESPVLSESILLRHIMPVVRVTSKMLTPADKKLFLDTDRELQMLWTRTEK